MQEEEDTDSDNSSHPWIEKRRKGEKATVHAPVPSSSHAPTPVQVNDNTKFPKFKIPNTHQNNAYDQVINLEKRYPGINISVKPNLEGDMILSPKDLVALNILNTLPNLIKLDPSKLKKIYILCGYSFKYNVARLEEYSTIIKAERCILKDGGVSNKESNNINVLSWNILGIRAKYALLQSQVAIQRPDIILLQGTLLRENKFNFANYKIYRQHWTDTCRGLLTLVKNTIPSKRIADINCHDANTLSIQITIINTTLTTHNIYRPPASILYANLLFAAAETQDTIISGDFNAHHPFLKSPSLTNSTGDHLHSLLEEVPRVKLLNNVDIPTHIAGGRLDLTFVSQNLRYGSTWDLHPILTSDHYGTVSSFRLEKLPDPPPPARRWNPDFAHWDLFEQHMTSWAEKYSVGPPEDSDNILLSLNNQLNEAAASSMPKKKSFVKDHKDSWYYNPRIKAMNKWLNRIRKLFRRNNTEALYQTLISVARHATEVANEVKEEKWLDWCSQATQRQEVLYPIRMAMVTAGCNISDYTDALYTIEELDIALSKTKDTAPGADNITYSMLKHMGDPAKEVYLKLINKTHVERVRPQLWRQQDTQPVPKPKEENAYRPIALITCTAKVAE
ncbi:uncharacterized protein [Palaemon carinicauda]|uniref:uncharacterized protein n=1 Tax=Palaemon carinicauda TaxID=392227 RepID=UPI0035B572E6